MRGDRAPHPAAWSIDLTRGSHQSDHGTPLGDSLLTPEEHSAVRRESLLQLARRIHQGLRDRRAAIATSRARLEARAAELEEREREVRWKETLLDRHDVEEARRREGRSAELSAWESSLRLESERLDSLWRRRSETLEAREAGLSERLAACQQRERELERREDVLRHEQRHGEELAAATRLATERETLELAAAQERLTREQTLLDHQRREIEGRSGELYRMVTELDSLLGTLIESDGLESNESRRSALDLPHEQEARTRQALAAQGERIAILVEQVQAQVLTALEDRAVAERLHRHLCTVCDPQQVIAEETSLRDRLRETLRGVVGLLREHRKRVMQWHASLDEQSQRAERQRRQRWEDLARRWKAMELVRSHVFHAQPETRSVPDSAGLSRRAA